VFAVFGVWHDSAFFTQNSDAEIPDFTIDLAKGGFGEFVGWRKILLKARHALQRAIDLFARQCAQNPAHILDLGDTMANHGEIISRGNDETNSVLELVRRENRPHIKIVGHDETIEAKFVAQQIGDDTPRQRGGRFLRLETWIPAVANHHAVHVVNECAKDSQLISIKLPSGAIDAR